MEIDYLEWINRAYLTLVNNQDLPKLKLKLDDGYISAYRCGDLIAIHIERYETKIRGGDD